MSKMAWFVHYWDEINNRNICSSEISAREDAMRKACSLMREGCVVSHVAGPNGDRVDIRCDCSTRRMISSFSDAGSLMFGLPHPRSCFF